MKVNLTKNKILFRLGLAHLVVFCVYQFTTLLIILKCWVSTQLLNQ